MILLKSLQLSNFLSHKLTKIDFTPESRILIDGKSGAGKSSIVEAISWAIFNKGRVSNRSLIKRGQTEAQVILELQNENGDNLSIQRKINTKGTHTVQVFCNGLPVAAAGTKNIQEYIEKDLIKCSYTLFINSVCYPQENLESFVRQTPANRKDIILELVRATQYDEYYEKVKAKAQEIRALWQVTDMHIDRLKGDQAKNALITANLDGILVEENKLRVEFDLKNAELDKLKERFITQNSIATQIANIDTDLTRMRSEFSRLKAGRDQYEAKLKELSAINKEDVKAKFAHHEALTAELEKFNLWEREYNAHLITAPSLPNFRTLIPTLEKEIINAEEKAVQSPNESCPHCGASHPCGLIGAERQMELEKRRTTLAGYKAKQEEYDTAEKDWRVKAEEILKRRGAPTDKDVRGELQKSLQLLKPFVETYHKLGTQEELARTYVDEMANLEKAMGEITAMGKEQSERVEILKIQLDPSIEGTRALLSGEVSRMSRAIDEITFKRAQALSAAQRNQEIAEELAKFDKEKAEYTTKGAGLALLKDAFGPNGIKAIVVDYVIPQLEDRMNTILSQLSNFRIQLNTQKLNASGDSTIEGLFITIVNEQGEEFDFDSYSGGERMRIIFAIAEGLAELQKLSFRILDEAVIGLDEETGKQFAETILALQNRFSQMVCVSHIREIKELFNQTLTCVNRNGDSVIL